MTFDLQDLLSRYDRIVIAGGPNTGKTTLCASITDRPVLHTDELIGAVPWADVPETLIEIADSEPRYVLEGVQAARALRKGLRPQVVVYLNRQRVALNPRQAGMKKAVRTVFDEYLLMHRTPDVEILEA